MWDIKLHRRLLQHDDREPQTGSKAFHHHVRWNLSGDIEWEKDGQCNVVLNSLWALLGHAQILLKTKKFGIADVGAIQKGKTAQVSNVRSSKSG
jgi:hypothetical protein